MKNCLSCQKEIPNRKQYCNNVCQQDYQYNVWVKEWKEGIHTGIRGEYGISNLLKRYLLEKYHNKCSICKWGKVNFFTNKVPLEVEHIDGNYLNNTEDNLIILCPNCHSLTATYKGANKGFGRKNRSKYK